MTEYTREMLDLRTKPTVVSGIVFDYDTPEVRFIDYQPGNGTRYWLMIVSTIDFSSEVNKKLGFTEDGHGYIITDINSGRTIVLNSTGFIAVNWLQSKLDCAISDAYVLTELLGELLDREYEKL
jgi:hypothetical protein